MKYGKKNEVSLFPLDYNIMLLGSPKSGKTSLMFRVCQKLTGEDGYIFLEIGSERGADALQGINYVNTPEWRMDEYDELTNSAGFADVCEDIIENRTTTYKDLRVIVWDTYDQLINLAEKESLRLYNKEQQKKGQPKIKNINSAWGGYYRGQGVALELMLDMKERLERVGVKVIVIGHIKNKEITDEISEKTYQQLTYDGQQFYFNPLKKSLHFLALCYVSRDIIEENKENKKAGKGHIVSETRRIRFRDNSHAVDCGSRFSQITPEIEMDSDLFIQTIEDAIKAEYSKSGKDIEKGLKEQIEKEEQRMKRIADEEKEYKSTNNLEAKQEEIKDFLKKNKDKITVITKITGKTKELGYSNPLEIDNIKDAEKILDFINEL